MSNKVPEMHPKAAFDRNRKALMTNGKSVPTLSRRAYHYSQLLPDGSCMNNIITINFSLFSHVKYSSASPLLNLRGVGGVMFARIPSTDAKSNSLNPSYIRGITQKLMNEANKTYENIFTIADQHHLWDMVSFIERITTVWQYLLTFCHPKYNRLTNMLIYCT